MESKQRKVSIMATFGFIGTGNMGGALARAICKGVPADQVFLANRTPEKAKALAEELECRVADNIAIAENADFIFLGVKPQMMIGTAKLMLETGKHPGELKDAVCSPGGATIQGIRALEEAGFRGAVMDAVIAAWEKSQGM